MSNILGHQKSSRLANKSIKVYKLQIEGDTQYAVIIIDQTTISDSL